MATYSFMSVTASLTGPTGSVDLSYGASIAKEGITITPTGSRNTMTPGADGEVMHSLKADKSGTVTVRLLKTSPQNKKLAAMFNAQQLSSSAWGNNVIVIQHRDSGDVITCRSVAFQNVPTTTYAEEGGLMEWTFDCGKIDSILGEFPTGAD